MLTKTKDLFASSAFVNKNITVNDGAGPNRQARRRQRHIYSHMTAGQRAVVGVELIKERGWTANGAASVVCVNPAYIGLARRLGEDELEQLITGELTLAQINKEYRQRLAERRAQRRQAEHEAQVYAARKAEAQAIEALLDEVPIGHLLDRVVGRFAWPSLLEELDAQLRQRGSSLAELVVKVQGAEQVMGALDRLTAPELDDLVDDDEQEEEDEAT
jgi:hypothetical protein